MKTLGQNSFFSMLHRVKLGLVALALVACLASCGEDEELQRQLIDLRKTVDAKNKSVEQLQAQVADLQSKAQRSSGAPSGASSEDLTKAKARIAELEQRLATASAAAATPAAAPQIGKLDMEAMASKLEEDLTQKAKQLRALVQQQSPGSRIDEITLKSIDYPPQLITPFSSAITFTVSVGTGTPLRIMFPVTADLGGSWKLPTPDEVQKAYKAAQEQPQGGLASSPSAPVPQGNAPSQPAPTGPGGGARVTQRGDGVFVFDWGDGPPGAAPNRQPQQAYTPPPTPAPAPSTGFVPPAPGGTPPPAPTPNPPAAAPQAPNVPPPVMPIVGDRVIRFD
jgi:hypothetical protein